MSRASKEKVEEKAQWNAACESLAATLRRIMAEEVEPDKVYDLLKAALEILYVLADRHDQFIKECHAGYYFYSGRHLVNDLIESIGRSQRLPENAAKYAEKIAWMISCGGPLHRLKLDDDGRWR